MNLASLVTRVAAALEGVSAEVLVVHDIAEPSDAVREAAAGAPPSVSVLTCPASGRRGGLAAAVAGLSATRASWVMVLDCGPQHAPEVIRQLLARAASGGLDIVVASRSRGAGSASSAGESLSRTATITARVLFPRRLAGVSDPMAGAFAVRREAIDLQALSPRGLTILLEILVRTPRLRVGETSLPFPLSADGGTPGHTKAGRRATVRDVAQLVALRVAMLPAVAGLLRFGLVGASGVLVNLLVLAGSLALVGRPTTPGVEATAEAVATQAAILWNFALTEAWVFGGVVGGSARLVRLAGYWLVSMAALVVQLPLAAAVERLLPIGYVAATGTALIVLVGARYVVCRGLLYRPSSRGRDGGPLFAGRVEAEPEVAG